MTPFDGNAYRKDVLKPLLERGTQDLSDAFGLLGLDPGVDDEAVIRERLAQVVAFWRKEQSSPRYKGIVSVLLDRRPALEAELLDPAARARLRANVGAATEAAEAARFGRLDDMLDTLARRAGGIPRSRLDRLRASAARDGITPDEFDRRLAGRTIVEDEVAEVEPLDPSVRRQVAGLLDELARLGDGPRVRTLWEFLGVEDTAPAEELAAHQESLAARNRQRRHDRLRTVVDELLALTTTLLVQGDPRRYRAALLQDVRDGLRPEIETALLLEDRVTAPELERLTRGAVADGVAPEAARALVIEVARSLSAPVEVGTAVDYVVCATCNATNTRTDPVGGHETCTTCGSPLYRPCPSCQRILARTVLRCPGCRLDVRAHDEAEADLDQARADLDAGLVAEAAWRVEQLAAWASSLPAVGQLQGQVEAARRGAEEAWVDLAAALEAGRLDDAADLVTRLARTAGDVAGPDGATLDDARARIAAGRAELRDRITALDALDPAEAEAAVLALLAEHPGSVEVLAALRQIPVAPPSRVAALVTAQGITVSWKRSPSAGAVEYRVVRTAAPDGPEAPDRPVGRTAGHDLEDAGVPAGTRAAYAVTAVREGIASEPARSGAVRFAPDVADLAVRGHDGAVELVWSKRAGDGEVHVERSEPADPSAPTRRLRGGERGLLDTAVVSGRTYRYRVVMSYPTPGGPPAETEGVAVEARAFTLPDPVDELVVTTAGRQIRIELPAVEAGVERRILRCAAAPTTSSGAVLEPRHLRELGSALAQDGQAAFDEADGAPRWYLPVLEVAGHAVVGTAVLHPGLAEVGDLRIEHDDRGPVVRWSWPAGCTEVLVAASADAPPTAAAGPDALAAKVTNTSYDLQDGWRPPAGAELRHVLVVATARVHGAVTPLPGWSARSTASA